MPLISIILPAYNAEKTIQETIESVLSQTFKEFELIVINDGSEDATLEIIKQIEDSRIKILSQSNIGQAGSRNRGLSCSGGEFIAFIDADDLWKPDKLEAQLTALQTNPQAAVCYSWSDYIDESGQFLRRGAHMNVTGDVYKRLLLVNFLENGSNPLIRRQALAEVGGFDESLTPAEDWDMWLRLAACYSFIAVPSVQILYRVYAQSSSSNISKLEASCLEVINRAFTQAPESLKHLKRHSLANLYKYLIGKALDGSSEPGRNKAAAQFLWKAVKNDPSLLRAGVVIKVLFKIAIITLLSPQQAHNFLTKAGKLSDIQALYGYFKFD